MDFVAWAELAEARQIGGNHVVLKSLGSLSRSKPLSIRSDGTGHPTEASYQGTSSFVPLMETSYQGTSSFVPLMEASYQGTSSFVPRTEASYQGTSSFVPPTEASYQGTSSFVPPLTPNQVGA